MKNILGLDLGTNSIGWAVVNGIVKENGNEELVNIKATGSRIIPMDAAVLGDFNKGNSISQTAKRTEFRAKRRLYERNILRRDRLHRILDILGFLPSHYVAELDRYGKVLKDREPKLVWRKSEAGRPEFIFMDSFNEMLSDFKKNQPQLVGGNKKVPYDWTIYYLRKKALSEKISKEELAWILLNFNQKRGYYQLRGEEETDKDNKDVEFYALKVVAVEDSGEKKGKDVWYNIHLENGWVYRRTSSYPLDWVGKVKEFIVTTDIGPDGTPKKDKEGNVKRSFRAPKEDDWGLLKKKTEADIDRSHKTVGAYIYDILLQNPCQKIRGKLVRTIERKYYKDELKQILEKQMEFHPELRDRKLYASCVNELYSNNEAHRNNISARDFSYLFLDDIIFYQRPLKSKKSLIDNCPYEKNSHQDKDTGKTEYFDVKCIAKSHPLFQEFRLWQFIKNLRIYRKEMRRDTDVTGEFLRTDEDYVALFEWLNDKKEIKQDGLLKYPLFGLKKEAGNYRWNYVEDKSYPCNETRSSILLGLEKSGVPEDFLTREKEEALWHILYSVSDRQEITKALRTFAMKHELTDADAFVSVFGKCPPFEKAYGSYSAKAIKKLLPLMRMGKYWSEDAIDVSTRGRINKIISGEYDESIRNRVREKAVKLTDISDFKGLPVWLACYIVYDRHSEAKEIDKWESPADIDTYLKAFKQHSLKNPIVEQVITETLRTVRDIWKQVGHIDEIHVELGREMKSPADKRARITRKILENENTNLRIKYLLSEFLNPEFGIENVRPQSTSQQDILRIYEDGVLNSVSNMPEDIDGILKKFNESDIKKRPTKSEVMRYKLWLEQKYRSPYTGDVIPLGQLFTPAYEIEHVIPQSRYFDNSFSNKVICEAAVNRLKDNMLGHEFIKEYHGAKVELGFGKAVTIFSVEEYEQFVKDNYSRSGGKMKKLLMDDIPDDFISRQANDSAYVSKMIKTLLSNIVREKDEQEAISKNVVPCTGGITDRLKKDWGVNDVWNRIILPRFRRMNELTGTTNFTDKNVNGHEIPTMPLELQRGFNKKRIDHRHHAMDAIVIACTTRNHVNLLNNEAARSENRANRGRLSRDLRRYEKTMINGKEREVPKEFKKPWDTFTTDMEVALRDIVVSFKQNLRVINRAKNCYCHFENGKKVLSEQVKGANWSIRKPMHKDTIFGEVNLRRKKAVSLKEAIENPKNICNKDFKERLISMLNAGFEEKKIKKYFEDDKDTWADVDLSKIEVYYFTKDTNERFFASRKPLDSSFDKDKIEKQISDTGIQKILLRHLESKENDPKIAFSPEGIDDMNRNIVALNNGKYHQPIVKVRVYEKGSKFAVGSIGNKSSKFVEAAKGTNLFFAVYRSQIVDKKTGDIQMGRIYDTIPLNVVIDRRKQGLPAVPARDKDGNRIMFVLSPGDLVYVPTAEDLKNGSIVRPIDKSRIYKMVSSDGGTVNFVPHTGANVIYSMPKLLAKEFCRTDLIIQNEFGEGSPQSKNQKALTGEMIKEICVPVKVDRLGRVLKIGDLCVGSDR